MRLTYVAPGPLLVVGPAGGGQPGQARQQVGPLDAGVVLEIAGAAVVRAVFAGQAQGLGISDVGVLHVGIEGGQLAEGLGRQEFLGHDRSSMVPERAWMIAVQVWPGLSSSVRTRTWA